MTRNSKTRSLIASMPGLLGTRCGCILAKGIAVVCLLGALSGCVVPALVIVSSHDTNVSRKEQFWGGFKRGQVYETCMDVFLERRQQWGKGPVLAPPNRLPDPWGMMEFEAPPSARAYDESPERWPMVIDIIKAGTRLRCTEIHKHDTLFQAGTLYPRAEILDGLHAGKMVNIFDLCKGVNLDRKTLTPLSPDTRLLREIAEEGTRQADP